jgi:hypothetical protein
LNLSDAGSRYNLGFTAASLRPELARIVAAQYLTTESWDEAKRRVLEANALQSRTASSAIRMEREFRQRLTTLSHDQLTLLAEATAEDAAAMAWLAAIKHTTFLFEFASELLRDKLAAHDPVLRHSDYEGYVEAKTAIHPQLAQLTDASKSKLRRVLVRMLAEAGILTPGSALGTIHRPVLSPDVVRAITQDDPRWLAGFLVPETEIARP